MGLWCAPADVFQGPLVCMELEGSAKEPLVNLHRTELLGMLSAQTRVQRGASGAFGVGKTLAGPPAFCTLHGSAPSLKPIAAVFVLVMWFQSHGPQDLAVDHPYGIGS